MDSCKEGKQKRKERDRRTYPDCGGSDVMMGWRPSFFLFFDVAAAVLLPFDAAAPVASGGFELAASLSCCEPFMVVVSPASSERGARGMQCWLWELVGTSRGRWCSSRSSWGVGGGGSRTGVDKRELALSLSRLSGVPWGRRRLC